MSRYLWETIFGPRPPVWKLHALLLWSLFGNYEDGAYGIYTDQVQKERDWAVAWKWWNRNPLHNLWFHTLAVPLWWSVCLLGKPNESNYWPQADTGAIVALNPLPYFAWRTTSWEGYIGYRPQKQSSGKRIGAFGIALRHR